MVYLLHFPATIAVSNLKYSLLIKPVLAICPETGRMLPSQTGPGLDYETMNHLEGRVPHSPGQAGQDYHVMKLHPLQSVRQLPVKNPMV